MSAILTEDNVTDPNSWAMVDDVTNIVTGIIAWDGVIYSPETPSGWTPPEGVTMVDVSGLEVIVGDLYDPETKTFSHVAASTDEVTENVVSE